MKTMKVTDAAGQVLCHDITQIIVGEKKGPVFRKGHIIREEDIPVKAVRAVLETNLLGFFLVSRSFVPLMDRGGSLVYVSTSDATMTRPGQLPYGPSKAGAEAMAAIMARELEEKGIRVNVICPGGFTDTNMAPPGLTERMRASGLPVLPPTVLNEVILYLASNPAADLTGEKLMETEDSSSFAF